MKANKIEQEKDNLLQKMSAGIKMIFVFCRKIPKALMHT